MGSFSLSQNTAPDSCQLCCHAVLTLVQPCQWSWGEKRSLIRTWEIFTILIHSESIKIHQGATETWERVIGLIRMAECFTENPVNFNQAFCVVLGRLRKLCSLKSMWCLCPLCQTNCPTPLQRWVMIGPLSLERDPNRDDRTRSFLTRM